MLNQDGQLINTEVRIETTNRCQARCTMCARDSMTRPLVDMAYKDFTDIVDQAKALGAETISLFGFGEPLLDETLVQKVDYCTKNGLESFLTTNAGLLDLDQIYGLLYAGLSHIRFSFHAIYKHEYEQVHKGLKYDTVKRNISNFLAINKAKFDRACEVSVSVIPLNGESVDLIRKTWEPSIDYLEVWRPHNWAGGKNFREVVPKKRTCGRPFSGPVQINSDKRVMLCCFDYDAQMILGHLDDVPLYAILRGEPLWQIQEAHTTGDYGVLPCGNCDQRNEYTKEDWPLLYSNRDKSLEIGKTSSCKVKIDSTSIT